MIARLTARRLAGVPIAPLLSLELHQHQAVGAILDSQDAESPPHCLGPLRWHEECNGSPLGRGALGAGQVREPEEERDTLEESIQGLLLNRLACSRQLEAY